MTSVVEKVAVQEKEEQKDIVPVNDLKHPLNSKWCLWYFVNDKNLKWEESQVKVASYDTVEDFWSLTNHTEYASRLKVGCDYSLFKEGIRPMWEDLANVNGGRWSISLPKQSRSTELDSLWLELLMMIVGENNEERVNEDICGAVVSVRARGDRIALWTASSNNPDVTMKIGHWMKASLKLPPGQNIEYNLHTDTSNKRSSNVRALYTV